MPCTMSARNAVFGWEALHCLPTIADTAARRWIKKKTRKGTKPRKQQI